MRKIKKNDLVIIRAGKDKGRQGAVLSIVAGKSGNPTDLRLLVEGINMVKRHTKGNPQQNKPGGILEKEASIAYSNVALLNQATGKADRVGFKVLEDGRKIRVFKSNGEAVDDSKV
jgi:large subunit ribosomal protein L24